MNQPCPACNGTGANSATNIPGYPPVVGLANCYHCKGRGEIPLVVIPNPYPPQETWKGFDYTKHISPYLRVSYVADDTGYIVWRVGTGGNVELLHLKVKEPRRGHGRKLFVEMLKHLLPVPPYETIFGFVLEDNHVARSFYRAMGFKQTPVTGVYRSGMAVVFSETYKNLKEWHNVK